MSRAFPHRQQLILLCPTPPCHGISHRMPMCARGTCYWHSNNDSRENSAENTLPSAKLPVWRKRTTKTSLYPYNAHKKALQMDLCIAKTWDPKETAKNFARPNPLAAHGCLRRQTSRHLAIGAESLRAIPGLRPSQTLAVPLRASSLQLFPGLEELLLPLPPTGLFAVQLNPFRAKFSSSGSTGKGKPGAAALQQNIVIRAGYFRLRFCRVLLLESAQPGAFLAPEVPQLPAAGRLPSSRMPLQGSPAELCQAPWANSAGAASLQSSVHNIPYVQSNTPDGEGRKASLVQKPGDGKKQSIT